MSLFNKHRIRKARQPKVVEAPEEYFHRTAPKVRQTQHHLTEDQVQSIVNRLWTMRQQFSRAFLTNKRVPA